MPRAKISDAYGITIELEANETTADALGDKALELLAKAVAIVDQRPTGPASGVQAERRGTPDHHTVGYAGRYFAPVKAQEHTA